MAKKLCLAMPLAGLTGNYTASDEHGHKTTLRFRELTATGTKFLGLGSCKKRNLEEKPYSEDEVTQHNKFKAAVAKRKLILASNTLKGEWRARFRADKEKTAATFNGYLLQQAMYDHVSDEGAYVA